jgi:hypothetical protein
MDYPMNPKARLGIPMHIGVVEISFRDGTPPKFFWFATETAPEDLDQETILSMAKPNGPFDSLEEAEQAGERAIGITDDCEIEDGGMWNPAWSKPH